MNHDELSEVLLVAIEADCFQEFAKIIDENRTLFDELVVEHGGELILNTIRHERRTMFDHLLTRQPSTRFHPALGLLDFTLPADRRYYVRRLIEDGAPLESLRNTNFPGRHDTNSKMLQFFLDKGLDPNFRNKDGVTLLHHILHNHVLDKSLNQPLDEAVAMLLCYGADPTSTCGFNGNCMSSAFQLVCLKPVSDFLFEQLMMFSFDTQFSGRIRLLMFLQLLRSRKKIDDPKYENHVRSALIDRLLECDLDFIIHPGESKMDFFLELIHIRYRIGYGYNYNYFDVIVETCPKVICAILRAGEFPQACTTSLGRAYVEILDYLLEKNEIFYEPVMNFIRKLDLFEICRSIVPFNNFIPDTTRILFFFAQYGLECNTAMFHIIYRKYADCDLFRTFLHFDMIERRLHRKHKSVMASFITDIHMNMEVFVASLRECKWGIVKEQHIDKLCLKTAFGLLSVRELRTFLGFFVHDKFNKYLSNNELTPEGIKEQVSFLPRVPLLQQLARDAFRQYLVVRFDVRNAKQLYTIINRLPGVYGIYKEIIILKKELYEVPVPPRPERSGPESFELPVLRAFYNNI